MTLALVVLGGAIGAPLRYPTDLLVQSRHDSVYPWGTFTVNVVGSPAERRIWFAALPNSGHCVRATGAPTWQHRVSAGGLAGRKKTGRRYRDRFADRH